jgi:G3E family GTPase
VYQNRRPFHPQRLWELIYDKFILELQHEEEEDGEDDEDMEEDEDDDEDEEEDDSDDDEDVDMEDDEDTEAIEPPSKDVILANKRAHPLLSRLFRSKGHFFLASRPNQTGEWSSAGAILQLTGGHPWNCLLAPEDIYTGSQQIDDCIKFDIELGGEWGDRRQELVFIGESLDTKGLTELLDSCLLNDEEFAAWEKIMRSTQDPDKLARRLARAFSDGFPDWAPSEFEAHDHDHDHAHDK